MLLKRDSTFGNIAGQNYAGGQRREEKESEPTEAKEDEVLPSLLADQRALS
jgi:hypothetical protein